MESKLLSAQGDPPMTMDAAGRFERLKASWKADTRFSSSILDIGTHPSYQQIIGMGPAAVPLILRDLSREPDHWFWALTAITGQDPAPEGISGDIEAMTDAWLKWGRERGYEC